MNRLNILATLAAIFVFASSVLANPIPWPPPAKMPLEEMNVQILTAENSLHARFSGDFTFEYIPDKVNSMLFPVPPGSADIRVYQDSLELSWNWSSERYRTILAEMPSIPMIEWNGPFPIEGCVFTVEYNHELIERPEEFIFFYAVGTGKYFPSYDKTTTAYFDIQFPSAYMFLIVRI